MLMVTASLVWLVFWSGGAVQAASRPAAARPVGAQDAGKEEKDRKPPPGETVSVTGTVVNRDGKPKAQAQVTFEGPKKGTAWTGSDGAFEFQGPTGDYSVTVKAGRKSQTFKAKITESGLQPDRLELKED